MLRLGANLIMEGYSCKILTQKKKLKKIYSPGGHEETL